MLHLREECRNDKLNSKSSHHPSIEDGSSEEEGGVANNEKNKCRCVDGKDGVAVASCKWHNHPGLTISARVVVDEVHTAHLQERAAQEAILTRNLTNR
ncbi:hypothetical protein Pcinc_002649 [Petrolisthes cinctipes]|uniref:Uncharacterized protein n=1 Tax=Petrolisthes cinctipes TaxID=88211 RepID=A0AAE1KZ22_PETCI|nr:hypothetical protein Pcinc_008872 [Petrolisthes cinctipes]KAK3893584.1 hypothetical protein Pcinc_002649 [Petrolisthes cinctipes]